MTSDIFDQEAATLAKFKQLKEKNEWSGDDFGDLINHYAKLLRTTKRIIKLSDKNEQRLNQLKTEAQDTNEQLEGMSAQLSKFLSPPALQFNIYRIQTWYTCQSPQKAYGFLFRLMPDGP